MKHVLRILIVFYVLVCRQDFLWAELPLTPPENNKTLTLAQSFALALEQSDNLKINQENIKVAEAKYRGGLSEVYPEFTIFMNERLRNSGSVGESGVGGGERSLRTERFESGAKLIQPIFSGFRDWILLDAFKMEIEARRLDEKRNKELLYLDLGEVFEQVLLYEFDLEELRETEEVLGERVKELAEFVNLGKAKESEVLAARAELVETQAGEERVERLLDTSKEMFSFLTGVSAKSVALKKEVILSPILPLESYIESSLSRADIKSAELRQKSQQGQVKATQREYWPRVSIEGNYYPYENPEFNREWDLNFQLSAPLFDAGRISSRIQEQEALARIQGHARILAEREAVRDVHTYYENLFSSGEEVEKLKKLVSVSEQNLEAQKEDYKLGKVTNLDVLQAIQRIQGARRALIKAEAEKSINLVRLNVASGMVDL